MTDETHSPELRSWVASANLPGCDFPIQNLPVGVFSLGSERRLRSGVAIGDSILEVAQGDLQWFLGLPAWQRREQRQRWSRALRAGAKEANLHKQSECRMHLPCAIGDYTDFYASIHHATNVGRMFRPDNPLLPNYKHLPVGYHGRASSIVVSGTPVRRPAGQLAAGVFGLTRELDYEVEVGCFIGPGNPLGVPVGIEQAREHIAGFCLVNDWSARDIQRWEYQPLGPFLGKSFATTISPWVVTSEAMEPFWVDAPTHDPAPLPYLRDRAPGGLEVRVEAKLAAGGLETPLSKAQLRDMYWTFPQMVAHHTSNGCNLRTGDLLASGTLSGPERENRGCLLEMTCRGSEPIALLNGETRCFLEREDTVVIRGYCERAASASIGFGECSGMVLD